MDTHYIQKVTQIIKSKPEECFKIIISRINNGVYNYFTVFHQF
jgi:hypothetical protein